MGNLTSTLTMALVDNVSKPARSVAQALHDAEKAAKDVAKGMAGTGATDRLQKSLAKLGTSKKDIEQVAKAWQDYSKSAGLAAHASDWTKAQASQVKSWESQTVAALRAIKREQASFAASTAASAKQAVAAQHQIQQATQQHRSGHRGAISTLAGATGANFVAGAGAEKAAHTMVHKAAEVEQLRFRIRELSRNNPSEAGFANNLASEVAAKYPGIGLDKALDTYIETRANSVDHHGMVDQAVARRNMMAASRAQNAALALGVEMTPTDMQNLLKGVEGSGHADDPKAVEKISDAYLRAKQVFGSAIASQMVRDYTANAKAANFSVGDEQFFRENLVRMSEGNASRLGNEVNQTLASLKGSMKKSAGKWLVERGLAKADDMENMGGGAVRFKQGVAGSNLLETQQGEWARTFLKDAIEKKGVVSEDKVAARMAMLREQELKANPNAQIDEHYLRHRATEGLISADLAKSGFRSTVIDNLAHLIGNEHLLARDTAAMNNASGLGAGDRIAQNPVATWSELTTSLQTFATTMGGPAVQAISPALDSISRGVAGFSQSLAEWQKNNPLLAKIGSGAAIGGLGAGGLALINSAFNVFGLKVLAAALDGSAAAGRLGVAGVAGGLGGAAAGGGAAAAGGAVAGGSGAAAILPAALGVGAGVVGAGILNEVMGGLQALGVVTPNVRPGKSSGHWENIRAGRGASYRKWISDSLFERSENENPENVSLLGKGYRSLFADDPWKHKKGYWLGAKTYQGDGVGDAVKRLSDPAQTVGGYGGFGAGGVPHQMPSAAKLSDPAQTVGGYGGFGAGGVPHQMPSAAKLAEPTTVVVDASQVDAANGKLERFIALKQQAAGVINLQVNLSGVDAAAAKVANLRHALGATKRGSFGIRGPNGSDQ